MSQIEPTPNPFEFLTEEERADRIETAEKRLSELDIEAVEVGVSPDVVAIENAAIDVVVEYWDELTNPNLEELD